METNNEIKDFNIAEILRYAPKMLELFSPIYGEVYFDYVNEEGTDIRVKTKLCGGSVATFNANGTFYDLPNSECLLFPSTHCRTWNHWQNTLFLESIGSICVDTITGYKYILENNGTFFSDGTGSGYSVVIENDESNYLLNSRYASPEEAKEFFEELEDNGCYWDKENQVVLKKKVVEIKKIEPKFKEGDVISHKDTGMSMNIKEVKQDCYYTAGGTCLLFKYQDRWKLVASKANLSLEDRVSVLADEILALKERVKALEIQAIRQCPDKAGDNVTLKDMKS